MLQNSIAIADDASDCRVSGQSDDVVLLVCPPELDQEQLRTAGESACTTDLGICNVWIWDNIEKVPATAPITDADLSEDQVRDAIAVWVNDTKRLVIVDKVK